MESINSGVEYSEDNGKFRLLVRVCDKRPVAIKTGGMTYYIFEANEVVIKNESPATDNQ